MKDPGQRNIDLSVAEAPAEKTRRLRLLVSTSTFPLDPGDGTPRFVLDLAETLAKRIAVMVLAPHAPDALRKERWGQVDVARFPYFWPGRLQRLAYGGGMRSNLRASRLTWLQVLPFLWTQARTVRELAKRERIDVVNAHWLVPQGLTAALARGRKPRFRHLLHVHAADVYLLARIPLGGSLARFVMRRTDAAFADGSHVRDALDRLLGSPSGAVLQPNGVKTGLFRPPEDAVPASSPFSGGHLLFVGRFVEKKGVVYLLRSLPRVRERHPDLGLVLIGYGPLEGQLRDEVGRLALEETVSFAGRKSHEEIVAYLRECRAAIVPSIIDSHGETEGMPTVVLEAMAAGARVVASAVDGIPDIVRHGENGWLCRPKDPEDLAEKILMALTDTASAEVAKQARITAQRYDWEQVAQNYLACLERLADGSASTGRAA